VRKFAQTIRDLGGTAYLVGGYVRDVLNGRTPKDMDFVITGLTESSFLTSFPDAIKVGKSFPVFLLSIDGGRICEVSFARTEVKTGTGYTGFTSYFSPDVTIENDLYRRDTTMNSIAMEILTGNIIDPYQGRRDIADRIIKATSHHFQDDPVRALRAARQAAQFSFTIEPFTYQLMRECKAELLREPRERFMVELEKALTCEQPSVFFRSLQEADLLDVTYPQIHALIGQSQPWEYHPEGDAFEHSMLVLDKASKLTNRIEVRFAALVHDIGKGVTPESELPKHYNHDITGLFVLNHFNQYMTLPRLWLKCARFAIENHMRAMKLTRPGKIVELLNMLDKNPIGVNGFTVVLTADSEEVPWYISNFDQLIAAIRTVDGRQAPSHLKHKEIGNWVFQEQIRAFRALKISY
jgi:tRNA nucleotidyltransferase (CCA-adding enzyme)